MTSPAETRLAITAQSLYLANLLILPGIAFAVLCWFWFTRRKTAGPVARNHLDTAFFGSLLAGVLLVCVNILIVLLGGLGNPATWVVLILYFTTAHAALVLAGMVALTRALAGQMFHLPLPGVRGRD